MANNPKVFEDLEKLSALIPITFYWTDVNAVIAGINKPGLNIVGELSHSDLVGKSPYKLYPKERADMIYNNTKKVIETGKTHTFEEYGPDLTTGKMRYYISIRSPLFEDGKIVGTVGAVTEITAKKEAERLQLESAQKEAECLQLENELQKSKIEEYEKFAKLAEQVAHDITSPLTSFSGLMDAAAEALPELTRISLREAHTRIVDIANNLLSRYGEKDKEVHNKTETRQPFLVSLALSQLLTEKKYQYAKLPVKFNYELDQAGHLAFIETEPVAFERMLSNLLNNSVEAFEGKPGKVNLTVNTDHSLLKIIIEDNGKGIPPKVLGKIRKNIAVTSGKEGGKGIGLAQVSETLQRNNIEFVIESKVGKGTKITLTFLSTVAPEWIADEICVNRGDIVVILDDDPSIHGAWEARFEQYGGAVKLQHFTFGEDAVAFINAADKDKIFLLADFELLKQKLNGIDVIKRTKIRRSILVTSHFNDRTVRDLASKTNIKILPKQLALKVTIEIAKLATKTTVASDTAYKNVDVVVIEDHKILADNLAVSLEGDSDRIVDVYYDGSKFLKKFTQYYKDTKFCIDYSLGGKVTGLEIAKKLYAAGYTKLFLTSGWEFDRGEIPDYVTIVKKRDIQDIIKALE